MVIYLKRIKKWLIYIVLILVILGATIISIGSVLTPYLNTYRPDFEKWASEMLAVPVKIKTVHFSWYFYKPVIELDQVSLIDSKTGHPSFQIQDIIINLSILKSI